VNSKTVNSKATWLTTRDLAERLQVSPRTIRRAVRDGKFLAPVSLPGGQRWNRAQVEEWERQRCEHVFEFYLGRLNTQRSTSCR